MLMKLNSIQVLVLILIVFVLASGCVLNQSASKLTDSTAGQPKLGTKTELKLTSSAFNDGEFIPFKYSCEGGNNSPPLEITGLPQETKSLVLIMDDPDAVEVVGFIFNHWTVFNIDPSTTSIKENQKFGTLGTTGANEKAYLGPCPPPPRTHTYSFKLYALGSTLSVFEGVTRDEVVKAMQGKILAQTELKGKYKSSG